MQSFMNNEQLCFWYYSIGVKILKTSETLFCNVQILGERLTELHEKLFNPDIVYSILYFILIILLKTEWRSNKFHIGSVP